MSDKPNRRWYQFSLRLVLALLTVSCVFCWWDPFRPAAATSRSNQNGALGDYRPCRCD
jgi:hypothetical protein